MNIRILIFAFLMFLLFNVKHNQYGIIIEVVY